MNDSFPDGGIDESSEIRSRFVLGKDLQVIINDEGAQITKKDGVVLFSLSSENGVFSRFSEGFMVGIEKNSYSQCQGIDIRCKLKDMRPVNIRYENVEGLE